MLDMAEAAKVETCETILPTGDGEKKLQTKTQTSKFKNKGSTLLSKRKINEDNVSERSKKRNKIVKKAIVHKTKTLKKQPSLNDVKDKLKKIGTKVKGNSKFENEKSLTLKGKKSKNNAELDEASKLQRRTRYLLIKIKLEQNFIDAYSTEGWKGQSREKIKPEKELEKANMQIWKCKLGIREALRQLDLLGSEGCINDLTVAPDGSVHHEHIICAKCQLREAFPDNDIILCDGTCNHAFHQKCLDPPLMTENIPPGDEGWFCKFCKKKMEILEATNAHLGTCFAMDSNWQHVFEEEAALPDGRHSGCRGEEEWPSDDSEDDNYDPVENNCSDGMSSSESVDSDCSVRCLGLLGDETLSSLGRVVQRTNLSPDNSLQLIGLDSDDANNEVLCGPRQRAAVDYIKLYGEMFGKNANENEQISDDEDWGPTKGKRKVKETTDAASTLMTLGEVDKNVCEITSPESKEKQSKKRIKKPIFRLPYNALEKLKLAFAKSELPERAEREILAKELGLEFGKVNKWFKNARYLALKARKAGREKVFQNVGPRIQKESSLDKNDTEVAVEDDSASLSNEMSNKFTRRKNTDKLPNSSKIKQRKKLSSRSRKCSSKKSVERDDDVSLKHIQEKAKEAKKKLICQNRDGMHAAEAEMERLCRLKSRVEKLQQVLLGLPTRRFGKEKESNISDSFTIYVPVAQVKEKR